MATCGRSTILLLPERQDDYTHLFCLSGKVLPGDATASCASLTCGYENYAFQATNVKNDNLKCTR